MKLLLPLLLIAVSPALCQTRILVGGSGGDSLNNAYVGLDVAVEQPFGWRFSNGGDALCLENLITQGDSCNGGTHADKTRLQRFEFDAGDILAPECHSGYGCGYMNILKGGGIAWITKSVGITSRAESSAYSVTTVSKSADYLLEGLIFRTRFIRSPVRLMLNYIRQFHNEISRGIETSQLKGVQAEFQARPGCLRFACTRFTFTVTAAQGRSQGNPVCDGTYGNGSQVGFSPCPRALYRTGGVEMGWQFEFPRVRNESQLF